MEEITVKDEDEEYVIAGEPWGDPKDQLLVWRIVRRKEEAEE